MPTDNFLYGLEIVMNNLNREEIGLKIKVRRICNHISQTDLAKWLDISQTHMSNVEAGKAMLSIELLFEVKQILGCTIDELLGLDVKEQKKRSVQNEETSNSNKALVLENIMKLDLKEVGNKIKERRVRKKLRQTSLSAELKITQMHLSNIENGKTGISFEVLMQLREKLDCDLEDLLVAHFK